KPAPHVATNAGLVSGREPVDAAGHPADAADDHRRVVIELRTILLCLHLPARNHTADEKLAATLAHFLIWRNRISSVLSGGHPARISPAYDNVSGRHLALGGHEQPPLGAAPFCRPGSVGRSFVCRRPAIDR